MCDRVDVWRALCKPSNSCVVHSCICVYRYCRPRLWRLHFGLEGSHFAHDRTFYRPVTVMQSSSTAADKRLFTSTQHTFSSHINLKIRAAWKCDNSPNPIRSIDRQAKPGRSSFAQLCFIVFAPPARPTPTHNTNCTMHSTVRNTHKHTHSTHMTIIPKSRVQPWVQGSNSPLYVPTWTVNKNALELFHAQERITTPKSIHFIFIVDVPIILTYQFQQSAQSTNHHCGGAETRAPMLSTAPRVSWRRWTKNRVNLNKWKL